MLHQLIIKNYALIDEVEIDFSEGFSTITGETGAGKSIMLGALGLLLGERADTKAISDKSRKTIVEAAFLDSDVKEIIVRREISPEGRSRAFVDDSPVTLKELAEVTKSRLDIHTQYANLSLNSKEGQLHIVDAISGSSKVLGEYRELFHKYREIRQRLRSLRELREKNEAQRSVIAYQIDEISKLNPKRGEQEEVERRFEMLSDADEIKAHLSTAYHNLAADSKGSLSRIADAIADLESLNMHTIYAVENEDESLTTRLKNAYIEIKDISETIEGIASEIEPNPAALAETGSRMKRLLEATRRFKVECADKLVDLKEELKQRYALLNGDDEESKALEIEERRLGKALKEKADKLSEIREVGADIFSKKLMDRAIPLGLPNLKFCVDIKRGKLTSDGQDSMEFRCSFNKNGMMLPMASTASGGELSRLTLTIKSLMAEKMEMPSIIFDEIDTGVSGEIADKMGKMMTRMGQRMQIITITHLPQVAAKGSRHYKVFKRDTSERTITSVKELKGEERINEIASMISGEKLSRSAILTAGELINGESKEGALRK